MYEARMTSETCTSQLQHVPLALSLQPVDTIQPKFILYGVIRHDYSITVFLVWRNGAILVKNEQTVQNQSPVTILSVLGHWVERVHLLCIQSAYML